MFGGNKGRSRRKKTSVARKRKKKQHVNSKQDDGRKEHRLGVKICCLCLLLCTLSSVLVCFFVFKGESQSSVKVVQTEFESFGEISYQDVSPDHIIYDETSDVYYAENQVLIISKANVAKSTIESVVQAIGGEIVGCIELTGDYQVEFADTKTLAELNGIVSVLEKNENIEYAMFHQMYETVSNAVPNDPEWENEWDDTPSGTNWGYEAINVTDAWDYYDQMETVKVGVIDSMFDSEHEDLTFASTWNGEYDATWWDQILIAATSDETIVSAEANYKHGTHVSGIIGATYNNDIGISGVCPTTELYTYSMVNWSDEPEYPFTNFTGAMQWKHALILMIAADCKVINVSMSWAFEQELQAEVFGDYLLKILDAGYDFLIVQSAGNDDTITQNNGLFTGIEIEEVKNRIIIVGAVEYVSSADGLDAGYVIANYSNYGDRVDVVAPGTDIYSTTPNDNYETMTGTSQAAPFVTGVAAMCFAVNPEVTAEQVKTIITNCTGQTISSETKGDYKMLNAYYCVSAAVQLALITEDNSDAEVKNEEDVQIDADDNDVVQPDIYDIDAMVDFLATLPSKVEVELYLGMWGTEVQAGLGGVIFRYEIKNDENYQIDPSCANIDSVDVDALVNDELHAIVYISYDDLDVVSTYAIYYKEDNQILENRRNKGITVIREITADIFVSETNDTEENRGIYQAFVTSYAEEDCTVKQYQFADLDQDGTEELLLTVNVDGSGILGTGYILYTLVDGSVSEVSKEVSFAFAAESHSYQFVMCPALDDNNVFLLDWYSYYDNAEKRETYYLMAYQDDGLGIYAAYMNKDLFVAYEENIFYL